MNIQIRLLLLSLLISLVTACGGGHDAGYSTGTVQLDNENSSLSIREFNFSPFDQSTWGANQLSSPLLAGLSFDITSVPTDTYDARAVVKGLYSTYSTFIYDVPVFEDSITTVVSTDSGYTGSLKVVNGTVDAKIIGLYFTPSTSSVWRENQIDSLIVPSGSMHLFDVTTGLYDVKVVWDVGPDTFYYDKSIESLTLLTLTVS
jgi:hypothetical protein